MNNKYQRRIGTALLAAMLVGSYPIELQAQRFRFPRLRWPFRAARPTPPARSVELERILARQRKLDWERRHLPSASDPALVYPDLYPKPWNFEDLRRAVRESAGLTHGNLELPRETEVLAVVPRTDEEALAIFGRRPTAAEAAALRRVRLTFEMRYGRSAYVQSRSSLESRIRNSPERVVIVIGHNSRGDLRLPSGASIPLVEVDRMARESGKQVVIISCQAAEYLTPGSPATRMKITYPEALRIASLVDREFTWRAIMDRRSGGAVGTRSQTPRNQKEREVIESALKDEGAQGARELDQIVDSAERQARFEYRVVRPTAKGGGVLLAVLVIIKVADELDDNDREGERRSSGRARR